MCILTASKIAEHSTRYKSIDGYLDIQPPGRLVNKRIPMKEKGKENRASRNPKTCLESILGDDMSRLRMMPSLHQEISDNRVLGGFFSGVLSWGILSGSQSNTVQTGCYWVKKNRCELTECK